MGWQPPRGAALLDGPLRGEAADEAAGALAHLDQLALEGGVSGGGYRGGWLAGAVAQPRQRQRDGACAAKEEDSGEMRGDASAISVNEQHSTALGGTGGHASAALTLTNREAFCVEQAHEAVHRPCGAHVELRRQLWRGVGSDG